MYLLDTNVVSLIAPARRRTASEDAVAAWVVAHSEELYLSVITAAEIEDSIARARRAGATAKAAGQAEWWNEVLHYWHQRILPLDLPAARQTGLLMDRARAMGVDPGLGDIAIAAIAASRGLTVLTCNEKDFEPLGVAFRNPLSGLPS